VTLRLPALLCLLGGPALALGPFEKNHPLVDEGMSAYDHQDFEHALEKFDAAAKERPADPRVQYDRGLALHKLGRHEEAKQAFLHAEELDKDAELKSKIHYNLGNVAAAEGDKKGAIKEYRTALRADPGDELARHNLEVMLRDLPPQQSQGSDGGTPDGGKSPDAGRPDAGQDGGAFDGGADAGRPDGGQGDGGRGDAGPEDGGQDGGDQGDAGQGDGGKGDGGQGDQDKPGDAGQSDQAEKGDGGADGGAEMADAGAQEAEARLTDGGMDKKEAEKLLDSFKSNEKNLQLWRFKQKTQKNQTNGKDW